MILNLKHLASVLDRITQPILQNAKDNEGDNTQVHSEQTTNSIGSSCNDGFGSSGTSDALNEREKGSYNDEDCRSSKITRDEILGSETEESRTLITERPHALNVVSTSQTQDGPDKLSSGGFTCFLNRSERSAGLEDDPTLLSRDDYLHFELDKDKIIVLPIETACKNSPEILKQYSIGQSRSDDLVAST